MIIISESKATVKTKYLNAGIITANEYLELLNIDPTGTKTAKYFEWIVEQYLSGKSIDNIKTLIESIEFRSINENLSTITNFFQED